MGITHRERKIFYFLVHSLMHTRGWSLAGLSQERRNSPSFKHTCSITCCVPRCALSMRKMGCRSSIHTPVLYHGIPANQVLFSPTAPNACPMPHYFGTLIITSPYFLIMWCFVLLFCVPLHVLDLRYLLSLRFKHYLYKQGTLKQGCVICLPSLQWFKQLASTQNYSVHKGNTELWRCRDFPYYSEA